MNFEISKILHRTNQYVDTDTIINQQERILKETYVLSSGSNNLDNLLLGGFRSGKMYLIFGANSTGKTQICHQLCIEAFKKFSKSIFIDTENTFRPERIRELSNAQKFNSNDVLKSILVSNIMSNSMFFLNLEHVENMIKHRKFKIIIIDSINNYYRLEQANENISFSKAKKTFLNILRKFNDLTNRYNIITIATAQITPNFVNNTIINEIPVGIQFLNHFFSESIYLSYQKESSGYAHLVNSFLLPEKKVSYKISSEGVKNYKI